MSGRDDEPYGNPAWLVYLMIAMAIACFMAGVILLLR
jgi:hypothetical protein